MVITVYLGAKHAHGHGRPSHQPAHSTVSRQLLTEREHRFLPRAVLGSLGSTCQASGEIARATMTVRSSQAPRMPLQLHMPMHRLQRLTSPRCRSSYWYVTWPWPFLDCLCFLLHPLPSPALLRLHHTPPTPTSFFTRSRHNCSMIGYRQLKRGRPVVESQLKPIRYSASFSTTSIFSPRYH